MSVTPLIDLIDAKAQLNITGSADDAEIARLILTATDLVNRQCGYTAPTVFTETVPGRADASGRTTIVLSRTPVLSVQSIVPQMQGLPLVDTSYDVINAEAGTVYLSNWFALYGPLTVTYTAGRADSPQVLETACALLVQDLWQTQRGAAPLPASGGEEAANDALARAERLMSMSPYDAAPGIA